MPPPLPQDTPRKKKKKAKKPYKGGNSTPKITEKKTTRRRNKSPCHTPADLGSPDLQGYCGDIRPLPSSSSSSSGPINVFEDRQPEDQDENLLPIDLLPAAPSEDHGSEIDLEEDGAAAGELPPEVGNDGIFLPAVAPAPQDINHLQGQPVVPPLFIFVLLDFQDVINGPSLEDID